MKKSKKVGAVAKYKALKTKGNLGATGLKTLVDVILGAAGGSGLGAASGRMAVPVGALLIAGSHYFEEQTDLFRLAGAATIAYGIGKASDNRKLAEENAVNGITMLGEVDKAKTRLISFKDDLFTAFFIDKLVKSNATSDGSQEVGAVDLSMLDFFEQNNENEAVSFELQQNQLDPYQDPNDLEGFDQPSNQEEYAFSMVDELPDLSML